MQNIAIPKTELLFEFHVAAALRKRHGFDLSLFATNGKVVFADFRAVRLFVHRFNENRNPRDKVFPGEVNATGLLEELFHIIIRQYEGHTTSETMQKAFADAQTVIGVEAVNDLQKDFVRVFPPMAVYQDKLDIETYLNGNTNGIGHNAIVLEEMLLLWLANHNPANKKLRELFSTSHLNNSLAFDKLIKHLGSFYKSQPGFGPAGKDLISFLMEPILAAPDDLFAQLEYIRKEWHKWLPQKFITQLLNSADLFREDFNPVDATGAPGPMIAPKYKGAALDAAMMKLGKTGLPYNQESARDYEENENFTPDIHWMPRVVLLAKNTYVWLDQLSKKYKKHIRTLDQIPDEELDLIADWSINGLWLIGLWERSEASRHIKHIMGNIDAVSSAYSLFDYQIAADLGGEWAYQNLNERAKARGIRLASDMVPNHTGLYSRWIIDHPEYFIQASEPPFPGYRFSGENLSLHPHIEIRIEDGYFSRSDAAVVFQRIDKRTGDTRYIYHGNDGTVMPWNDTAQLDMLKHDVRQAVIDKIFEVARKSSIIRFDAAMTLAKKHFSRLWYPRPGTGGDIPSRSDYAMSQEEFDQLFPVEFWREVVDRINKEMPETLLLAEAFWFMEGYFVRTLGMHRVYNSAFMHMLKNEENEKYRDLISNTLEFEPEILKRYVNFMSNPDEETAIRQFGTGDKYIGICILMTTLPGLPMFGHGQIEGYTEKYGMEYQRAYYNETPDEWLVSKHEKEIFPLAKKRYLFSEVEHFNLFDFFEKRQKLNENVFAYTNRYANERALVFFNNKFEATDGSILWAAPKLAKGANEGCKALNLAQALGINIDKDVYFIAKEHISGLEYLYHSNTIASDGFHIHLNGFEYRVFIDFREIIDTDGDIKTLYRQLNSKGVDSIDRLLGEMKLKNVHDSFIRLFDESIIRIIIEEAFPSNDDINISKLVEANTCFEKWISEIQHRNPEAKNIQKAQNTYANWTQAILKAKSFLANQENPHAADLPRLTVGSPDAIWTLSHRKAYWESALILQAFCAIKSAEALFEPEYGINLVDEFLLIVPLRKMLEKTGKGMQGVNKDLLLIDILLHSSNFIFDFSSIADFNFTSNPDKNKIRQLLTFQLKQALEMLSDEDIQSFIGVNTWKEISYFSKENYEELTEWLFTISLIKEFLSEANNIQSQASMIELSTRAWIFSRDCMQNSEYKFDNLKKLVKAGIK